MEVSWIKIKLSLFDDEKIKIIESLPDGDSIILVWIKLLIIAGKSNRGGSLSINDTLSYTDQMLSAVIGKPESFIRISLKTLIDLGMVEKDNDRYYIINWNKHQNADALEIIRKQTANRVKKYRAHMLNAPLQISEDSVTCNVTVTQSNDDVTRQNKNKNKKENKNIDIELKEKEIDKEKKSEKHYRVFTPPSLEETSEYFILKNFNTEEASRYFDYYTSNGWMVGKSKMKNWQAAANNWMRNVDKFKSNGKQKTSRDIMWKDFVNG